MKKAYWFFIAVILLVVLALVLLVVNINALFPTPSPQAFAQSLGP